MERQTEQQRDPFLALEDAIDAYISPDNKEYEDLYIDRISYETGHTVKLKIEKVSVTTPATTDEPLNSGTKLNTLCNTDEIKKDIL